MLVTLLESREHQAAFMAIGALPVLVRLLESANERVQVGVARKAERCG